MEEKDKKGENVERPEWQKFAEEITEIMKDAMKENKISDINSENIKDFFFALSVVFPSVLYNIMMDKDMSYLEFNHASNSLCVYFLVGYNKMGILSKKS